MFEERKIKLLTKTVSRQKETIEKLKKENEMLVMRLEEAEGLSKEYREKVQPIIDNIQKEKEDIENEYRKVIQYQQEYKEVLVEIKQLKKDMEKEMRKSFN